jgi:periplasmic protein TonB
MVLYNIKGFRSREGPAQPAIICRPAQVAVRERSLPGITRRQPVYRSLSGSVVLHVLLLFAALVLASDRPLPIAEEPEAVALVFQQPAPPAAPAEAPVPPAPPQPVEPQQPPPPTPAPQPAAPVPLPPVPETAPPPPPPEDQQPSLPLPPPPAPPPPPEPAPARRATPQHAAARPAPSPAPTSPAPPRPAPSAPAPSPSAPTAAAASAQPTIAPNWQGALAAWLEAHKTYPEQARRRGEQGRASVRFTVEHSGRVLDVAIVSSTGSSILDDAIERMLRGAHVPPLPANMDETQVTVTVQIRYALE